jgi:hypothetical protein
MEFAQYEQKNTLGIPIRPRKTNNQLRPDAGGQGDAPFSWVFLTQSIEVASHLLVLDYWHHSIRF